jgi:hypothetical protein
MPFLASIVSQDSFRMSRVHLNVQRAQVVSSPLVTLWEFLRVSPANQALLQVQLVWLDALFVRQDHLHLTSGPRSASNVLRVLLRRQVVARNVLLVLSDHFPSFPHRCPAMHAQLVNLLIVPLALSVTTASLVDFKVQADSLHVVIVL